MLLLRRLLGDALRRTRQRQHRTLRDVSAAARVSLGYLSEVERGQKEPSSELLAAICDALDVELSDVLREISATLDAEHADAPVPVGSAGGAGPADGEREAARVVVEPVVIEPVVIEPLVIERADAGVGPVGAAQAPQSRALVSAAA